MTEDDLKWIWAAYRKGAFDGILEEDLGKEEFKEKLITHLSGFTTVYSLMGGERKPVGIMGCQDQGYRIEPHALWFPWATPRNKIESWLNFLNKIRVIRLVILIIEEKNVDFFEHLSKYGVIQRRGTISRFFEDGQYGAIFQSRD